MINNNLLDYEMKELEDGTWQVWTPDFSGACIGLGATKINALISASLALFNTSTLLKEAAAWLLEADSICETHKWKTIRQTSPADPDEIVVVCDVCGAEKTED